MTTSSASSVRVTVMIVWAGHRELGVGALNHNRHHLTATQIRAYAGSSVHDLADHLDSADLRQCDAANACFLLVIDAQALADVREIDSDSRRLDKNLPVPGEGTGRLTYSRTSGPPKRLY